MEDTRFTYFLTTQEIQSEAIKNELQSRGIPVKVVVRGTNIEHRGVGGGVTSPFPVDILVQDNQRQQAK
ncbi:MAG: hypothetical protein A2126_02120 [Candidatus Woykebacteria bacterium GWB1_45_5]|uniref:DUF2007 domain-containing protein n=2 Tax=Candidatus Woykeibacteriota TaxID=1817899 RepID=A0A1G1W123_9BACT|nr:MAG: hypothetical protein A2113_00070 [Candidatus Woykebacteria bacterium GWA1_44_8]OGY24572.1 MAG: hypothetical protein A2126_02120 [Candidatus Woykebacteria bacterium GWB1_45_5]